MLYNIDNITIEKQSEKSGIYSYSITYDPFFLFIFSMYNVKHTHLESRINFVCENVKPLSQYIKQNSKKEGHVSLDAILKMIYDLGLIIKTLENKNKSILCFSIDDIIVLNNETFLFINPQKILDINAQKNIIFKQPISLKTSFLTPDVDWSVIPIKPFYTTAYYSFASMIIFILFGETWNSDLKLLDPIYRTKLYYFLLRCLEKNPRDRRFLYI